MRMWMVNPEHLCNQHLMAEHNECHKLLGHIRKRRSIDGYVRARIVQPQDLAARHDEVVEEMLKRNMMHKTPIEQPFGVPVVTVSVAESYKELIRRCPECRKRIPVVRREHQ